MNGTVSVGPVCGVVLATLIIVAVAVTSIGQLGLSRDMVTASVRAIAQLGAVSLVITAVLRSWWSTAAFITLMVVVAAATSARRISTLRRGWPAIVPITAGAAPIGTAVVLAGTVPFRTVAVLPAGDRWTSCATAEASTRPPSRSASSRATPLFRYAGRQPARRSCRRWTRPVPSDWSPYLERSSACCSAAARPSRPEPPSCSY